MAIDHLAKQAAITQTKQTSDRFSNELKAKALLDANPDLILRVDKSGDFLEIIEPQGWHPFDIKKLRKSRSVFDFMPDSTASKLMQIANLAMRNNEVQTFEYHIVVNDTERSRECRVVKLNGSEFMTIIRDITERKNMELVLQHIVDGISTSTGIGFFQSLVQYIANYFHAALVVVGEYEESTQLFSVLAGAQDGVLVLKQQTESFLINGCAIADVIRGQDVLIKHNAERVYPQDHYLGNFPQGGFVGVPLRDSKQQVIGAIAVFDNKTLDHPQIVGNLIKIFALRAGAELERLKTEKNIQEMTFTDELTQLPNKRALLLAMDEILQSADRQKGLITCLFINFDRFRLINDVLGHMKGDFIIHLLARRLSRYVGTNHSIVARFGSDEFVVVLTQADHVQEIEHYATRLLSVLREPVIIDGEEYSISASIGISLFPRDGKTSQCLLQNADVAMHLAKDSGRNVFQFYRDAMHQQAFHKLSLENRLRQALQERQFVLHYQPQISIETRKIIGMEALVRWVHPEQGLLSPAEFIPLAEETGMIIPLGTWVLYEACRQNKAWQDAGYAPLRVAVNISPIQFRAANFVDIVRDTLHRTKLEPKWLELEFTESLTMEKGGLILEHMRALYDMGVAMSIDDFGTGYSSLSYLKSFPIQSLKIDRSFVDGMTSDHSDAAIINAIIAMGKSLNLSLVAEGIETEEQFRLLRGQQCQKAQGYLFSKPLSPERFEASVLKKFSEYGDEKNKALIQ